MTNNTPNFIKFRSWGDEDERSFEILDIKSDNKSVQKCTFSETIQCLDGNDHPLSAKFTNDYPLAVGKSYDEGYFWSILKILAWSSGHLASDLIQNVDEKDGMSEIYTKSYTNK